MKRDMDLVRLVLLEVEKNDNPMRAIEIQIDDYSPDEVSYHVMLLEQAGYLTAINLSHQRGIAYRPKAMTWEGHEFLSAIKSGSIWNRVKAKLAAAATDAPLSVIKQLAMKYAAEALGLFGG